MVDGLLMDFQSIDGWFIHGLLMVSGSCLIAHVSWTRPSGPWEVWDLWRPLCLLEVWESTGPISKRPNFQKKIRKTQANRMFDICCDFCLCHFHGEFMEKISLKAP